MSHFLVIIPVGHSSLSTPHDLITNAGGVWNEQALDITAPGSSELPRPHSLLVHTTTSISQGLTVHSRDTHVRLNQGNHIVTRELNCGVSVLYACPTIHQTATNVSLAPSRISTQLVHDHLTQTSSYRG